MNRRNAFIKCGNFWINMGVVTHVEWANSSKGGHYDVHLPPDVDANGIMYRNVLSVEGPNATALLRHLGEPGTLGSDEPDPFQEQKG
jgi:hypothetical protein